MNSNDELRQKLHENRHIIEEHAAKDFYRYKRYNIPFSIAIFHSSIPHIEPYVVQTVRESDIVIPIDEHYVCVVFDCVAHADAYKAAENMIYKLTDIQPKATFSAGITSVSKIDELKDMVYRAMGNLHLAMSQKSASVEDDSVVDFMISDNFQGIH